MQAILAIDQGTTNTKALLVGPDARVIARASQHVNVSFPQPGWVEQDAREIWRSVVTAIGACRAAASGAIGDDIEIVAVGLTNQRETAVVWDRATGQPVGPCIVWQCRRTAAFCETLAASHPGLATQIRETSGLALDPLFSASKISWILRQTPNGLARAAAGELCAGTIDSWLLWNLTAGAAHTTDASNASRTQLLNLATAAWDSVLLRAFDVPLACLPEVRDSSALHGYTAPDLAVLPADLPICGVAGDSHAALFGHAAFVPGLVKATYGTGSSLMSPLAKCKLSQAGLSTTVAWSIGSRVQHAFEGNITNTGGGVEWLASFLGFAGGTAELAALAESTPDSGGVYLVPAFAGLGAPHWDTHARGIITGLTRGPTPAHAARAAIEAIAYQVADVFDCLKAESDVAFDALLADGGASANAQLMQFQADIIDRPVIRNESGDVAAIGAAWLAGLSRGFWTSTAQLSALPRSVTRFEPHMPQSRRDALLDGWRDALDRCSTGAARRGRLRRE